MRTQSSLFRTRVLPFLIAAFALALAQSARAADGSSALQFDGVDDSAFVPHAAVFNSRSITVATWIKTTQTNGLAALISKYDDASLNGWQVFLLNGVLRARYSLAPNRLVGANNGLSGGLVADGQWHHITFVVDDSGGRVVVDGGLRAAQGWIGTPGEASNSQPLKIGTSLVGGFFEGRLDELSIWDRALSGPEVALVRNHSLLGREAGLRAYFRFNEGVGNFAEGTTTGILSVRAELLNDPVWVPGVLLGPAAGTLPPDATTSRSARLQGLATSGGTNTSAWFEWGATTNYGNTTPPQPVGAASGPVAFERFITGLTSAVPIHFRAVASNALGFATGTNVTFTPRAIDLTQERRSHTTTLLPNGKVLVAGGFSVSINGIGRATNSAELRDPVTGVWSPTAPMSAARAFHTATMLQNGRVLVVDAQGAELFDPATETWLPTGRPNAAHNSHTATLLQNGQVLVAGGLGNQPELYDPATGRWTFTGALAMPRTRHTATLLPNGKVLVAGGERATNQIVLASAELYDPVTGNWSSTGSMRDGRFIHTATLRSNGRVLMVGGADYGKFLDSAEEFDPATGNWSPLGTKLQNARGYHTATLLPRGDVLVVGGYPSFPSTAEVLGLADNTWHPAPALESSRWGHSATLLPTGTILLTGGFDPNSAPIAGVEGYEPHLFSWTSVTPIATGRSAHTATLLPSGRVLTVGGGPPEIFTPTNNAWSNAPALNTPRVAHTATLLPGGQVLIAGGYDTNLNATTSAELFDFGTAQWTYTGSLAANRYGHTATLLANGQVLIAGGVTGLFGEMLAGAELYNPGTGLWTNTGSMTARRSGHTASLLANGKVLVAGGAPDNFTAHASAELYDPATGQWTATSAMTTSRAGHRATLLPNGTVLVTGGSGGFFLSHASAEIFDPATGAWSLTTPMIYGRQSHSATLLPGGRVLVAGGYGQGYLDSAELYDPATRAWTLTDFMSCATYQHTATLLSDGNVLVLGGWTGNAVTNRAEVLNTDLGADPSWRPRVNSCNSSLAPGDRLSLGGLRFRGVSGGSDGGDKDSPTDYPVVQVRSLESERTVTLLSTNWSTNTYISLPIGDFPTGWAMTTVLVNGTPGVSVLLEITASFPPALTIEKLSPSSVRVLWPSPSTGYVLQQNADVNTPNWLPVAQAVSDNGTNKSVTLSPPTGRRFYRLIKP